MGSILYDFLDDSVLFAERNIENSFRNISDKELFTELQRYREFCLENMSALADEIESTDSNLRVFSGVEELPISLLKQSAFYVEQLVLRDPLFVEARPPHNPSKVFNQYLGLNYNEIDRKKLTSTISMLKQLSPMIAANFIKLFPTSYFFESPEETPIYYSENNYAEGIPEPLLKFFHSKAKVFSLERIDDAYVSHGKLYPCRNISVEIGEPTESMLFQLFETR